MQCSTFKSFAMVVLLSCLLLFTENVFAQDSQSKNLYEDNAFSVGIGLVYHTFSEVDDFRKPTGSFGSSDEIKNLTGIQINGEFMLNDLMSLSLPFGISTGYRFQTMNGGFEYTVEMNLATFTREVTINNHIGYVNLYYPLGSEKYCLIGGTIGIGASEYVATEKTESNSSYFADGTVKDTSRGFIIPVGGFIDWGADGFGGRFGVDYILSKYKKTGDFTPKGNGIQACLDLRYAF